MIEREWREASDMRRATATLALILASAAFLRFWQLGAGIPFAPGVDEPEIMNRAVEMMRSGDFNPRFYDYPSLYIYVQLGVAVLRFLWGAMGGEWTHLSQAHVSDFYLWARVVTAVLGTITVALVYFIGLRWGTRYALLASALMAVMPLHVRESHFALTDVPVTFFVTLAFLLSLRAHERPRVSAFFAAGIVAGLAAATKYTGALALLLPLITALMTPDVRPSRILAALAAIGGAAVAFLIAAPYTLLDLPGFLNGYAHLMGYYTRVNVPEAPAITYLKHLRNGFWWSTGGIAPPGFVALIGGVAFGVVRAVNGPGRLRWTLAVVFPLVFFWFLSRQSLVFGRYLLPILPFASILIAAAVVAGVGLLRRFSIPRFARTALILLLTLGVILPPGIASINFNRTRVPQTTVQTYDWINQHIPPGSTVIVESAGLLLSETPYKGGNVAHLRSKTYEEYVSAGVDYLVASSEKYGDPLREPQQHPNAYRDYRTLFSKAQEVARFTPPQGKPWPEFIIFKVNR